MTATGLLSRGDVDLGRGDHIDVVFDHRLGVIDGKCLAQRLLAADVDTEAGFEHLARRLARSEPGKADLFGQALERGVDFGFELSSLDLDAELDLVGLDGFDGGSHRRLSVSAPSGGLAPCSKGPLGTKQFDRNAISPGRYAGPASAGVAQW